MGVRIESEDDKCRVHFEGDLTIYTVAECRQAILASTAVEGNVEVNLSQIGELDTSGLQLLAALDRQVSDAGNSMICVGPNEQASETLELSRFIDVLHCENNDGLQK